VYRVEDDRGAVYAVKAAVGARVDAEGDAISKEWAVVSILAAAGRPVARPVGYDERTRCMVTAWASGPTVDEAAQLASQVEPYSVTACLAGLREIEAECERQVGGLRPYITHVTAADFLNDFAASFARAREAYYVCVDTASELSEATVRRCDEAWKELWDALSTAPTTLGPLDVNARNLILGDAGPVFIDLSIVGADWSERRAVQYLTSSGRAAGHVVSVLSPTMVRADASMDGAARHRLDGHALLVACLAIAGMLERREGEWPSWPQTSLGRAVSARRALIGGQLTPYAPTELLRAEAAQAWAGG
jgi:hypothetical protein